MVAAAGANGNVTLRVAGLAIEQEPRRKEASVPSTGGATRAESEARCERIAKISSRASGAQSV